MSCIYSSVVMVVSLIGFILVGIELGGRVALVFCHTVWMMVALTG
jgi:hypothetical protein